MKLFSKLKQRSAFLPCRIFFKGIFAMSTEIKALFIISVITVLTLEPVFGPNSSDCNICIVAVRLGYSLIASVIFFYINQHRPKLSKRTHAFRFLNNTITRIDDEIKEILLRLDISITDTSKPEDVRALIIDSCKRIPHDQIVPIDETDKKGTWREYLYEKSDNIIKLINDIKPLEDIIDPELLECLLNINDLLHLFYLASKRHMIIAWHGDIAGYSDTFYHLYLDIEKANRILEKKYAVPRINYLTRNK